MTSHFHEQNQLTSFFEPQTLSQLNITGHHLIASVSYHRTKLPKTGIIAKLCSVFKKPADKVDMDIDLACVVFDKNREPIDTIWYGKLRNHNQSIRHAGDALIGADSFEKTLINQEQITVRLTELSDQIAHMVFVIQSHHKQPLNLADHGVFELKDNDGNLVHKYNAAALERGTQAVMAWYLKRDGDDWRVSAPFDAIKNSAITDSISQIQNKLI